MTDQTLRQKLDIYGNILCIAFQRMEDGPDPNVGLTIMKKKLANNDDISRLKTAFVVYESQSQANKCVKARSRNADDGMQAMHKYDYNKVVKRLSKGVSPLFTPQSLPMTENNRNCQPLKCLTPQVPKRVSAKSPVMRSRSAQNSPVPRHHPAYRKGLKTPDASWNMQRRDWRVETIQRTPTKELRRRSGKTPVTYARGPDGTKGFRWPRNPDWSRSHRTIFEHLGGAVSPGSQTAI